MKVFSLAARVANLSSYVYCYIAMSEGECCLNCKSDSSAALSEEGSRPPVLPSWSTFTMDE